MQLHIYGPQARHAITCDIAQASVLLGRAQSCDVQLPFKVVSSRHMQIQRDDQGGWALTDLGSTNGTMLNGQHLPPHQPAALEHDASIEILDLRIVVDLSQRVHEGFTLAERETFVRQMVSQALVDEQGAEDLAFFEIVRGAKRGQRVTLLDTVQQAWIGSAHDALWHISPGSPEHAAQLMRQGDGFVIIPKQGVVCIDGAPVSGPTRLLSRQRVLVCEDESIFFDPLQEYLDGLEGLPQEEITDQPNTTGHPLLSPTNTAPGTQQALSAPAASSHTSEIPSTLASSPSGATAQPSAPHTKQGWSAVEVAILVMTIVFVLGGVVVMLFVLGVIGG